MPAEKKIVLRVELERRICKKNLHCRVSDSALWSRWLISRLDAVTGTNVNERSHFDMRVNIVYHV